jgi:hypothetical protein
MKYSPLWDAKSCLDKTEIPQNGVVWGERGDKKRSQLWTSKAWYFRGTFSTSVETLLNICNRYVLEDVAQVKFCISQNWVYIQPTIHVEIQHQHARTWSAAAWLPHRLCHHPAVFFRYPHLTLKILAHVSTILFQLLLKKKMHVKNCKTWNCEAEECQSTEKKNTIQCAHLYTFPHLHKNSTWLVISQSSTITLVPPNLVLHFTSKGPESILPNDEYSI